MKPWLYLLVVISVLLLVACTDANATPPRPTVIVITSTGPYYATFDDPGDWLIGQSEISQGQVRDGRYWLKVLQPETLAWTTQQRIFGDAAYEVEAQLVSGPEASGFGLLLLGSSDVASFFYCMITGDGRYDIGYCKDSCETQESLIGGYTLAPAILPGNQVNQLRVELKTGTLRLLVNGTLISQIQGLSYSEGLLGLIGESAHYGGFEAAFDNLQVLE